MPVSTTCIPGLMPAVTISQLRQAADPGFSRTGSSRPRDPAVRAPRTSRSPPSPLRSLSGITNSAALGLRILKPTMIMSTQASPTAARSIACRGITHEGFGDSDGPDLSLFLHLHQLGHQPRRRQRILLWRNRVQVKHVDPVGPQRLQRPLHPLAQSRRRANETAAPRDPR